MSQESHTRKGRQTSEEKYEYLKSWKLANPDKVAANQKRWYEKNAPNERERARQKYYANRDAFIARQKAYYQRNRAKVLAKLRIINQQRKLQVMEAYGGIRCRCCGETESRFLTIDHINGCSKEQRKREGQGSALYVYLVKHNFPAGFQVLCFNCNLGREANGGVCPHQEQHGQQEQSAS